MQEHGCKQWQRGRIRYMSVSQAEAGKHANRLNSKLKNECIARLRIQGKNLKQENKGIQRNQQIVDEWRGETRLVVANRYHEKSGLTNVREFPATDAFAPGHKATEHNNKPTMDAVLVIDKPTG